MSSPPKNLNITPALKPPLGLTSNLINPPSKGYITIIVCVAYLATSTPLVCLRMYVRRFINRKVWWDDWTCLLGWVGLVVLAGCLIKSVDYGNGTDQWNVSVTHVVKLVRFFTKVEIIARVSIVLTKVSILLLFIRTFIPNYHQKNKKNNKTFYAIWAVMWFNILYCIAIILVLTLQCVGKKGVSAGKTCVDSFALFIASSVTNVITDVIMLIIPLFAIWNLHMATQRKVGIAAIFAVGTAALGSSLARLAWQLRHAKDPNRTIVLQKVSLLAIAEHAIGLIVACMPVIPAFFRHIKSKRATTQASSTAKESWKPSLGSNSLSHRAAGRPPRGSTKDPYLLSRDYKELDDLESANALPSSTVDVVVVDDDVVLKGGGTTTTIIEHSGESNASSGGGVGDGSGSGGAGGGGDGGGGGNSKKGVAAEDGEKGRRKKAEVMVSRSVQVESHPIGQGPGSGVGIGVIPPAHLKR